MVAESIRQEKLKEKETDGDIQCDFDTDDEDGEAAYDAWRLRELTRLKRDREERDQYVKHSVFLKNIFFCFEDVNANNKSSNVGII